MGCHILSFIIKNLKKYLNNNSNVTVFSKQMAVILSWTKRRPRSRQHTEVFTLLDRTGIPVVQMVPNIHHQCEQRGVDPHFPFRIQTLKDSHLCLGLLWSCLYRNDATYLKRSVTIPLSETLPLVHPCSLSWLTYPMTTKSASVTITISIKLTGQQKQPEKQPCVFFVWYCPKYHFTLTFSMVFKQNSELMLWESSVFQVKACKCYSQHLI